MTTEQAQSELENLLPVEAEAWFELETAVAEWNVRLASAQKHVTDILSQRRDRLAPHEKRWLPLRQRKVELESFLKLTK